MQKQKTISILYFFLSLVCFVLFLFPYNKITMWSVIPGEDKFSKFNHSFTGFHTMTNFQNVVSTFLAIFQILCLVCIIILFIFSLINLLNVFNITNITLKIGKLDLNELCLVVTFTLFILAVIALCLNFGFVANRNNFLNKNYNMEIQTKYATLYKISFAPILSTLILAVSVLIGYMKGKKLKKLEKID